MSSAEDNDQSDSIKDLLTGEIQKGKHREKKCNCTIFLLFCGIINLGLGIFSVKYDYLEIILLERIRMRPGLPPFEFWRKPPVNARLSVTIFNYTNIKEFLDGIDKKLKIEEIQPIVYEEIVEQTDIVFHKNSTMSFTTIRKLKFIPELNEPGILEKNVTIVNFILLGLAGFLYDTNIITKMGFNAISSNDNVIVTTTIDNLLWNFKTPVFQTARTIVPFIVHRENAGILYNAFYPIPRRYNIRIGTKNGFENFGKINTFNYNPHVPGYENEHRNTCFMALQNASDGANNPLHLTRNKDMILWRELFCRTVPLSYENDTIKDGMNVFKYVMKENIFDRFENRSTDCYKGYYNFDLPDGLLDSSKCAFEMPVAVSLPHFYGRSGIWDQQIEGLSPNKEKHMTYTLFEPTTGIPLEGVARLQSNIVLPKLHGFSSNVNKFSEMIVPNFWIELALHDLTPTMTFITQLIVNYIPIIQNVIAILSLLVGNIALAYSLYKIKQYFEINICCTSPNRHLLAKTYNVANREFLN